MGFWRGFGSIVDLFGVGWQDDIADLPSLAKSDAENLASDWEAVGRDLWGVMTGPPRPSIGERGGTAGREDVK